MARSSSHKRSGEVAIGDAKKRAVVVSGFVKKGLTKRLAEELEQGISDLVCPNAEPLLEGSSNYKEYKSQYKRLCTHIRQNPSLSEQLRNGVLAATRIAGMADEALMGESQRSEIEKHRLENLNDALGITPEDSAHWTHTTNFTCPSCEGTNCLYIQTFKGQHSFDDKEELTITVRCVGCRLLWKEDEVDGGRVAVGQSAIQDLDLITSKTEQVAKKQRHGDVPSIWGDGTEKASWLLPAST